MEGIAFSFGWEVSLMIWIQDLVDRMGSLGVPLAWVLTELGEETILVAFMGFLYWSYDEELGKKVGCIIMAALVFNPMVKNLVLRRRPYFDHGEIRCLRPVDPDYDIYDLSGQGFSFPSGHSTNATVVYAALPVYQRGGKVLKILAVVMPLLVGISRCMLGVHYPTDVLCGWIMGTLLLVVISTLQKRVSRRYLHMVLFLIACLGLFYCKTADYYTAIGSMAGFFLTIPFEEKFVKFENSRKPIWMILRVLGGFAVYVGCNTLLKLPFSAEFLESGTMIALLVRSARYLLVMFVMMGVYPMLFKLEKRLRKKKQE